MKNRMEKNNHNNVNDSVNINDAVAVHDKAKDTNETSNHTPESKPKRPGLIRQPRVIPNLPDKEYKKDPLEEKTSKTVIKYTDGKPKKVNINQQRNIKVSIETKKQLDVLLKFSGHKFAYELIDSMIDVYLDHALDPDQRRAFKTLYKMMSD